jgi:hypothetical protein
MAKGGWEYGRYFQGPHSNAIAEWEADWDGISDAIVNLGVGWSVDTGNDRYTTAGSDYAWWRGWVHSSGARLAFLTTNSYNGTNKGSGAVYHAENNHSNRANGTFANSSNTFGWAYSPPGNSGWGAGLDPNDLGFITLDDFRFGIVGYDQDALFDYSRISNGTAGSNTFHFIGKDDDLFIVVEKASDADRTLEYMWCFGTLLSTLAHPTLETDANISQECFIGCLNGITGLTSSDSPYSFYRTPSIDGSRGTTRPRLRLDGMGITWITTGLATTIHSVPELGTEPWVAGAMYTSRTTDLPTEGVIAGSGMKGLLDSEKIRIVQGWSLDQRQTLDGGNFIYVGGGLAIGWDPNNGPML